MLARADRAVMRPYCGGREPMPDPATEAATEARCDTRDRIVDAPRHVGVVATLTRPIPIRLYVKHT